MTQNPAGCDVAVRRVALSIGLLISSTVACLIVFFVVGGPFGTLNDAGNAGIGILSAVLAALWHAARGDTSWPGRLAVLAAVVGSVVMIVGSWLIISDTSGYYFAGLVSSLGAALIGGWLLVVNTDAARTGYLSRGLARFGLATAIVMLLGLLSLVGIAAGMDDQQAAAWYVSAGPANFLGTYLLYPIWCLQLTRRRQLSAVLGS